MDSYHKGNAFYVDEDYEAAEQVTLNRGDFSDDSPNCLLSLLKYYISPPESFRYRVILIGALDLIILVCIEVIFINNHSHK